MVKIIAITLCLLFLVTGTMAVGQKLDSLDDFNDEIDYEAT